MKRMAGMIGRLMAVGGVAAAFVAHAAEPWALWTDFSGADAAEGLAPQASSTQNGIDGGAWRFRLAGDASVSLGGVLSTGTGAAPRIDMGASYNLGTKGNPITVVMRVQGMAATPGKPLWILGTEEANKSIGVALAEMNRADNTATIKGMWSNAVWGGNGNVAQQVPSLAGDGTTTLAVFSGDADGFMTASIVTPEAVATLGEWSGLRGDPLNSRYLYFGNTIGATSGGLDFKLVAVAVFRGEVSSEDLLAVAARMPSVGFSEASGNGAWVFEDVEGVERQEVTVAAASSPSAFTVNNAETAYVIGGAAIGGTAGLLKQGSGTLSLKGANTFSGGVTIEGGTVVESGVSAFQSALGTGKNGSWANRLTLRNGTFDLNGTENYRNNSQTGAAYWGWLCVQTLTLGGQAGGTMAIRNGVFGIGTTPAIVYDATGNPGTATISAAYNFSGTSGTATREFRIADSSATETEIDFVGGLHVDNWVDGQGTTIEKTGAGTMQISSRYGFPGLKVTGGTVRMNAEEAFVRGTVTLAGGTLDLNGTRQTLPALAGTEGTLTSEAPAELTVAGASTYGGAVTGAVSVTARAALTLSGDVSTAGTLTVAKGGSLTLSEMPANARIVVDCADFADAANGTSLAVLTIPGEIDEGRIEWHGLSERPHLSVARDPETGTWALAVARTADNFIVMPMGDSITEGSGSVENAPSYRKALAEQMMAAGMNPRFVGARIYKSTPIANEDCRSHTGLSGHRIQTVGGRGGYLQGAPNWLEQAGYPDAITLMIGTNDCAEPPETVFGQWKALVGTMVGTRPQTWIVVAPIIPPQTGRRNDVLTFAQAYNERIKGLFDLTTSTITVNGEATACVLGTLNAAGREAFGESARVIMASMYDALPVADNAAYFFDNLHPSQAGYDRMAAVWLEAIKTIAAPEGGLKDAEAIVDAYQTAGAMDSLTVVFNRQQKGTEGVTVTVGGVEAEVSGATLSADGRRVTLALAAPLDDGAEVTVAKGPLSKAFTARDKAAASRVAPAQKEGYVAVKALDMPEKGAFSDEAKAKAAFAALEGAEGVVAFDRLGYYVTLARPDGALRWLWVSMDRPAAYATVEALGLPTANVRTKVFNLRVDTNVPGIDPVAEDGVEGLLQFGPNNIATGAADTVHPASLGAIYDWNSAFGGTAYGYGAMQVFRLYEEGVGRAGSGMPAATLFSYSRWATADAGNDEITLGDLANHQGYATGNQSAASLTSIYTSAFPTLSTAAYSVRRIEIWVRPTAVRTWAGATEGTWDKAEASVWAEDAPFADGNEVAFGALNDGATSAAVTVGGAVAPSSLAVTQNAYTFAGQDGAAVSASALNVSAGASAAFDVPLTATTATVDGTLAVRKADFAATPTGTGTLVKTGTVGVDDLTLDIPGANVLPAYEVQGGKLTLTKDFAGNGAAFAGGAAPFFKVASGAHLVWDANDLVGWSRANTVTVAEVSGVLEKTSDTNETFSGRLLLKDGGELRNSAAANFFLLHNSAIVEAEAGASASLTGNAIKANGGTPELKAGEGATLTVSAPLSIPGGITLRKSGPGTALLKAAVSGVGNSWGTLSVAEGTLRAADGLAIDATLTVGAGATFEMGGAVRKGGLPMTVEGTLAGHGTLSGSNNNATLTLAATATVVAPAAAGETLTLTPGGSRAVAIAAGATVVVGEGSLCLTNGYAKSGTGAIAVALPEGRVLARGEALPVLTSGAAAPSVDDFAAPEGLTLYVEDDTLFVANVVAIDRPAEAEEAWSPAAALAITEAVGALPDGEAVGRVTEVRVETKGGASVAVGDVAAANAALACFTGIATATDNGDGTATVTVAYDFGVTGLTLEAGAENAVVTVRVQGAEGREAGFAEGVRFAFVDPQGTEIRAGDGAAVEDITSEGTAPGTRTLRFPLPSSESVHFRARVFRP